MGLVAKHACALVVATVVVLAALAVSCAPRRAAPLPSYAGARGEDQRADGPMDARMESMVRFSDDPEAFIREQDAARLGELDEIERTADARLRGVDGELYDDLSTIDAAGGGRGGVAGALRKAGLVTYVVFATIVTLGMSALPFLV